MAKQGYARILGLVVLSCLTSWLIFFQRITFGDYFLPTMSQISHNFPVLINTCGFNRKFTKDHLANHVLQRDVITVDCRKACLYRHSARRNCINLSNLAKRSSFFPTRVGKIELTPIFQIIDKLSLRSSRNPTLFMVPSVLDIETLTALTYTKTEDSLVIDLVSGVLVVPLNKESHQLKVALKVPQPTTLVAKDQGTQAGSFGEWFRSVPKLHKGTLPKQSEAKKSETSFVRVQERTSLILLVITSKEQIDLVNTLQQTPFDSFFNEREQFILVIASKLMWKSGALESLKLVTSNPKVKMVPEDLVLCNSRALLELQGLSYALLLDQAFSNVIVFPFNRLPSRIWSEVEPVSFGTYSTGRLVSHWEEGKHFVNDPQGASEQARQAGPVSSVFQIPNFVDKFGPHVVRALLICDASGRCTIDSAKSIPWGVLERMFLVQSSFTASTVDNIFGSNDTVSYADRLGEFFAKMFSPEEREQWVPLASPGIMSALESALGMSADWMFTTLLVGPDGCVPPDVASNFLKKMNMAREDVIVSKGYGKECLSRLKGTGNLALHSGYVFNVSMIQEGEFEFLSARAAALEAAARPSKTRNRIVFLSLIHTAEHIELMSNLFNKYAEHPKWGFDVVVVADKRLLDDPSLAAQLQAIKSEKVHLLPDHLATYGAWGSSSLVFKELTGYVYAFTLFDDLSHVVLISGDSVPVKTRTGLTNLLSSGTSYISFVSYFSWEQFIGRCVSTFVQCATRMAFSMYSDQPVDSFIGLIKKHSQWKVLSGEHIRDVFLATTDPIATIVNQFQQRMKFMEISDEHWVGSLLLLLERKGFIKNVVSRWSMHQWWNGDSHPEFLDLNYISEHKATLFSGDDLVARKVSRAFQDSIIQFVFQEQS